MAKFSLMNLKNGVIAADKKTTVPSWDGSLKPIISIRAYLSQNTSFWSSLCIFRRTSLLRMQDLNLVFLCYDVTLLIVGIIKINISMRFTAFLNTNESLGNNGEECYCLWFCGTPFNFSYKGIK